MHTLASLRHYQVETLKDALQAQFASATQSELARLQEANRRQQATRELETMHESYGELQRYHDAEMQKASGMIADMAQQLEEESNARAHAESELHRASQERDFAVAELEAERTAALGPRRALVRAIWTAAHSVDARCVVVPSTTGQYARLISRNDFLLPVLALASDPRTARRMLLYRGVTPVQSDEIPRDEALVERAEKEVLARGWAEVGDYVLVVVGEIASGDDAGTRILVHRINAA